MLAGLDIPSRRIAVKTLTEQGLSTRAIAPVVGVSQQMVVKDLHGAAGDNRVVTSESADDSADFVCTIHHDTTCPWDCVGKPAVRDTEVTSNPGS